MKLLFLLAFRADNPRVIPELARIRKPCSRCGQVCRITLASSVVAGGLPVVCTECLTPREMRKMRAHVTPEQLAECADHLARQL